MNFLLIIDLIILITSSQLEILYLESKIDNYDTAKHHNADNLDHYGDDRYEEIEEILVIISITILSVFGLEIMLSLIGEGWSYLYNPLHCMDVVVISLGLYFEIVKEGLITELLIIARLWRFTRLIHGAYEVSASGGEDHNHKNHTKDTTVEMQSNGSTHVPFANNTKVSNTTNPIQKGR
jgi:hypothetical protein